MFDASMAHRPSQVFDFTMCNPPFYGDEDQKTASKVSKRGEASQDVPMLQNEKITKGGEVVFIRQMMKQSSAYKTRCKWYTTMVGIKKNFDLLLKEARQLPVSIYHHTSFCAQRLELLT